MGATTPVAFDPKPERLGDVQTYKAGAAILRGQVVAFAATGVDFTVHPAIETTASLAGVALANASTGDMLPVAGNGSILTVMCAATDTTVDAGDWVSNSTVAGTVIVLVGDVATHETEAAGYFPLGRALADVTAGSGTTGGTVEIEINMGPIWTASS